MTTSTISPWLAYTRGRASGAGSGPGSPLEHATVDGKTTLCGVREIGGHEPTIPFKLDGSYSCRHCVRKVAKQ